MLNGQFTIGQLAKRTGCKVQTIRYYEQIGLMPEALRTEGNQRRFGPAHRERLASSPPMPGPPGGQFVLNARALPGNPYDGHTLKDAIEDTERLTGRSFERAYVDKGYRGHDG